MCDWFTRDQFFTWDHILLTTCQSSFTITELNNMNLALNNGISHVGGEELIEDNQIFRLKGSQNFHNINHSMPTHGWIYICITYKSSKLGKVSLFFRQNILRCKGLVYISDQNYTWNLQDVPLQMMFGMEVLSSYDLTFSKYNWYPKQLLRQSIKGLTCMLSLQVRLERQTCG